MPDISILVCTVNRMDAIRRCLESIRALRVPSGCEVECIVVDNNSTDGTHALLEQMLPTLPFPARRVFQPVAGASRARNTAIEASRGDVLALTDDDCIVDADWLAQVRHAFAADPDLQMAGGRVELYNPTDLPETIKTSRDPDVLDSAMKVRGFMHGCNMAMRRSAVDKIGAFDERLGGGTPLVSAEDTDLVYRAYAAGLKIAYCPDIMVYHNHGRSTVEQQRTLHRAYKTGQGAFYAKHLLRGRLDVLQILYVQLRPPLRRWLRGPNRLSSARHYFVHLRACPYILLGAYRFVRLHGIRGARRFAAPSLPAG